jgi:hypothetical protein
MRDFRFESGPPKISLRFLVKTADWQAFAGTALAE